jgi:F-type H+-transporting ATPase subunit delta
MKNPILVKRYAEGLAQALPEAEEYESVRGRLAAFNAMIEGRADLRTALLRPFLGRSRKAALVAALLEAIKADGKSTRFLELLLRRGRLELLPGILEALPAVWRTAHGLPTFEVRSAAGLTPDQRAALEAELARLEGRPVHCEYGLDPSLLGGLTVRKGNRIFDVSLKGQLDRLKDTISER